MQKSYRAPNPGDNRSWFLIDAKDQPVGRLAVVIANKLDAVLDMLESEADGEQADAVKISEAAMALKGLLAEKLENH